MSQDHASPVPRRTLAIVRASTEAGPAAVPPVPDGGTAPSPGASSAAVPVLVLAGKPATVIGWTGIFYHVLIGHPLKAAMKAVVKTAKNIEKAAERPLRLFMLAVFVSVLVLLLLHL